MRFKVIDGSQSAHCCFEATVVDTTKPGWGAGRYEPVCECFERADAEKIAAALSAADSAEPREDTAHG